MWKDFFSFTRRERITVAVLTSVICLVQVLIWTTDRWLPLLPEELQQSRKKELALRQVLDSIADEKRNFSAGQKPKQQNIRQAETFLFDPNTADSLSFSRLGFSQRVIRNILKYRSKGGVFKKPSDLSRIYGMDASLYSRLEQFIQIENGRAGVSGQTNGLPPEDWKKTSSGLSNSVEAKVSDDIKADPVVSDEPLHQTFQGQTSGVLEINKADTTQLMHVKGVGKVTAERIVSYRKALGGFYHVSQLDEIKGLYPETKQRLMAMLTVDAKAIRTLSVNKLPLEAFRKHPYISFWQAKVIVELRKARGRIENIEELSAFKEFKKEDLEKLKWYLSFQ